MKVSLNKTDAFDLQKLIDSRLLVQANSGGGKSWAVRRILEQSHGKVQQIVIDPEGEFATLREKYDYLLIGKDGDIPISIKTAGLLAHKLLEFGTSAIIDLYELPPQDRKRFVRLFLDAMVNSPKPLWHKCLVVIDEAHVFCPEKGESEAMGAVIDLATRGRKREFCSILATQRISKLHKDAAAECNNKMIGRCVQDIDRKRAGEELGFTTKDEMLSLRSLAPGEFYIFGPAISDDVKKIRVGEVITTHKSGSNASMKLTKPTEAIKQVLKKLTDLPQEAESEARTIAELKAQVLSLKTANNSFARNLIKPNLAVYPNPLDAKKIAELESQIKHYLKMIEGQSKLAGDIFSIIKDAKDRADRLMNVVMDGGKLNITPPLMTSPIRPVSLPVPPITVGMHPMGGGPEPKIIGGALRMIKVLVSRYPMKLTKSQLATFSKMKPSGGSYGTYMSALKSAGLIEIEGDLIFASQAGLNFVGESPNPPQSSDELIKMWSDNLTGGARRMFDVLYQRHPDGFTKEELGEYADVAPSGGSFGTYLSILRSNGLIEQEGNMIKLSSNLFV